MSASIPSVIVLGLALATASVCDAASHRIPNLLTYPLMLAGLAFGATRGGAAGAGAAALGLLIGAALLLPWRLLGGMGSGDLKLMAGVGAVCGPRAVPGMFLAAAVIGGLLGLLLWVSHGRAAASLRRLGEGLLLSIVMHERRVVLDPGGPHASQLSLPYALPIALGTLLVVAARWSGVRLPAPF